MDSYECNIIIHQTNITIRNWIFPYKQIGLSNVRGKHVAPTHVGYRRGSDGDAIAISGSSNIWIDHCYLASCTDGLIDVIHASTGITISNNYFTQHDKVMLLGHNDNFVQNMKMKVTVAFNHFGPGLMERMPPWYDEGTLAHVANNRYDKWIMYAIGGSADPTIFSEGNYSIASDNSYSKEANCYNFICYSIFYWLKYETSKDVFKNGAYFVPSGYGSVALPYSSAQRFPVAPGNLVPSLTADAGPLNCYRNRPCY
ncbi:hypothetical protein N665_1929s0010 [Sinapis alba]|nr:hypothetical protein N665_1929s0010 [Sinapis alba]